MTTTRRVAPAARLSKRSRRPLATAGDLTQAHVGQRVTVTTEHGSQTGELAQLEHQDGGWVHVVVVTATEASRHAWSGALDVASRVEVAG